MRILSSIVLSCFLSLSVVAQFRYSETIFEGSDTLKAVEYAQADFLNKPIALLEQYNIHEGEETTKQEPLFMDIFMPKVDTLQKRPAILFVHSGAFLLGSRYNEDMIAFCDSFARKGYVTASIDYRKGMGATVIKVLGVVVSVQVNEENVYRAVYRGVQDGRAAIRFLKHNADVYGIDSTKIFMVGSSAGALIALHNLYYKEEELPEAISHDPQLGSLDAIGISGPSSSVLAAASFWGAVQKTELLYNSNTPVFLVHGQEDDIVPFHKGEPLKGSVPHNPIVGMYMPDTYGSFCIDTTLTNRGVAHENYFVPEKKHEFYGVNTGDFNENGPNQYWDTIHWKLSDFLLEQFKPDADFETHINGVLVDFTNLSSDTFMTEWDFGDGFSSNETNPQHLYEKSGTYLVNLKTCNGNLACDTVSKWIDVDYVYGLKEYSEENLQLYPNPVKDKLYLRMDEDAEHFSVYTIFGRKCKGVNLINNNIVDVSGLPSGVYVITLQVDDSYLTRKFLKVD